MTTKEERTAEAERAGGNLRDMAEAISMTPLDFFEAVKRQCVSDRDKDKVTAADFVAFFHTAKQYGLDPLRKEILIIGTKQGPRVYVTFDGWLRVLVSHPDYKAHGWRYNGWCKDKDGKQSCESVTFWLARKSMAGTPYEISEHTEFMSECFVDEDWSPWRKYRVRMLAEKAAMQGTRFFFAMYVPDLDDVTQAGEYEAGRNAAAETPAKDAPPAQGPISPAAAIPGAKRSSRKKPAEEGPAVAALPAPTPGVTMNEFIHGKSEPVPVAAETKSLFPETAATMDRATLPAFDPKDSFAVELALADAARAAADPENFDDII